MIPRRTTSAWLALAAIIAALLFAPSHTATAQPQNPGGDIVAVAEVASPRAYVGDAVRFRIRVDNAERVQPPDLAGLIPGLSAEYAGTSNASSVMTTIINGRMSRDETRRLYLEYTLRADKPGRYTIPALTVDADGIAAPTKPVSVQFVEPTEATAHTLQLEFGKSTAFEGEWVPLTLTWTLGSEVRVPVRISTPDLDPDIEIRPLWPVPQDEAGQIALQRDPSRLAVELFGTAAIGVQSRTDAARLTIPLLVRAGRAGRFSLGPVAISFLEVTGRRQRTFFDSPWDDPALTERRVLKSGDAALTVEPLPTEGRPADFSGLVGSYALRAAAAPTTARVGEPITLRVEVSAPAPLDALPPLDLFEREDFRARFRVPRDPLLGEPRPDPSGQPRGIAAFTTSIRARSSEVKEIPPISFSFFDPESRTYAVAASTPIPLSISGSSVQLDDEESEDDVAAERSESPGGLPPLMAWPGGRASRPILASFSALTPLGIAGLLAAPPMLVGALATIRAARARSARHPAAARRRRALRRALRTLRERPSTISGDPSEAGRATRALCGFVADMLDAPDAGLTPEQCLVLLREKRPAAADLAAPALARWSVSRFSPGAAPSNADGSDPIAEARRLIPSLRSTLEGRPA